MSREAPAPFCEGLGGKFPRSTHQSKHDSTGALFSKISHTYDALGNIDSTTHWITPTLGATERWEYDSRGRRTVYTDELGQVTRTLYSEDQQDPVTGLYVPAVTTIHPSDRAVEKRFDPYERVAAISERSSTGATLSARQSVYDPNGNLLEQRDDIYAGTRHLKTTTHQWKYDARNRKIEQIEAASSPDERVTRYSYFLAGQLQSKELPGGVNLQYAYDGLGHLSSLRSMGADSKVAYAYTRNRLGQLLRVVDQATGETTNRLLDPFGNVLEETLGNGLTITKTYDAFDRPLSLVYPDGSRAVYAYDSLFLREVKRYKPGGQLLYTHSYPTYNLRGELETEILMGTLGKICHAHDKKGRQVAIQSDHFAQSIEEHDLENNPLLIREGDEVRRLSYDELSQLTGEESEIGGHTYSHDSNHNRLSKDGEQEDHNDLNQLLQRGELTYEYDLQGRLAGQSGPEESASYTYDALDRLTQVKKRGIEVTFTYDPLGRRLSKHVHNPNAWIWKDHKEKYFYDQDTELGATDEGGRVTHARVLGLRNMRDIGSAVGIEIEGNVYAPFHDLQGSVRALIDPRGVKRATYQYTAFGEDLSPPAKVDNPWCYLSKRWDRETGLILFGKRYYDPTLGRWLTQDSAGFSQSMNLYNYCLNNPWCWVDPDGQFVFLLMIPIMYAGSWASAAIITDAIISAAVLAATGYACHEASKLCNDGPRSSTGNAPVFAGLSYCYQASQYDYFNNDLSSWLRDNPNAPPAKDHKGAVKEGWKDVGHPDQKAAGHHEVVDPETGDKWRYDEPRPGASGHEGKGHWHHDNPSKTGKGDHYIDRNGNPCRRYSDESHLYY